MKRIELKTPGIMITLPTNGYSIRTPYTFITEDKNVELIKSIASMKGIMDINVQSIEESKIPIPKEVVLPKIQMRRKMSSINLNLKTGGGM